jgi:O-methyltransferase
MLNVLKRIFGSILGDKRKRYESRFSLLSSLAAKNNFRLYNKNLNWHMDTEFLDIWHKFPDAKKGNVIHERKFNLYNLAKAIRDVPGDLAECGVFKGASSYLMLAASSGTGKHFYGFDSFEGLSAPVKDDRIVSPVAFVWQPHDLSTDLKIAERNLREFDDQVSLLKGWIPERFAEVGGTRFSLVHIDVDLYDPTMASVKFFFSRLNPGGLIVCDDYGFETCPGARKAMDDFARANGVAVAHLTTGQGLLWKLRSG